MPRPVRSHPESPVRRIQKGSIARTVDAGPQTTAARRDRQRVHGPAPRCCRTQAEGQPFLDHGGQRSTFPGGLCTSSGKQLVTNVNCRLHLTHRTTHLYASCSTSRALAPARPGPHRARERRGPHCSRSVRRGSRAGLPVRRFGGVPPPPSPAHAVQAREVGLHAQSSHPPPAGPGTAVRPPSRGREGRRPRDGRRTPALATAHPAGLKNGPARRVRLSQIPASRTANRRSIAAAERPGRRISARSP